MVDGEERPSYILTYSYAADNTLSAVKESFGGVEKSTRYVYNKDNSSMYLF